METITPMPFAASTPWTPGMQANDELSFDFAGQVRFRGLETDDQFLTQPNELRTAYLEELARFTSRLDDLCYRNGIERVPVDTSRDMATVFTDYLTQRSLMARR